MRCYLVQVEGCCRLASTGGDARATRQSIADEQGVGKKDVEITLVELKTAKPALLALVNSLLKLNDNKEGFEVPPEFIPVDKDAKKAEREAKKAKPAKAEGAKPAPAKSTPAKKAPAKKAKPAPKKGGKK